MTSRFQKLKPGGTKFCYQSDRYPQTISWKVCVRCAHVGLINSKPFRHCTNSVTAPRTSHPRNSLFACDSRLTIASFASFLKRVILAGAFIPSPLCHPHVHGLTKFLFHLRTALRPPLYPLNRSISCNPQQGVQFGRLPEQSPLTSCEPNDPVEVSSTELTTTLLPSRKASIASTCNSGEDIAAAPASSEVDEKPIGMLASPLLSQERETRAASIQDLHSNREDSESTLQPVR